MENNHRNTGSLVVGALLVVFGALALLGQIFEGAEFLGNIRGPLFIVGVGAMFFVGMFMWRKIGFALAIGSIITAIGLMLFLQNLFNHFEGLVLWLDNSQND